MRDVITRPLTTKKIALLNKRNMHGFVVAMHANKIEIKKAIEKLYGVTVNAVNTLRCRGKKRVRYTKKRVVQGKQPNYKKAIVTLRKGDVLDIYRDA